MRKKRRHDDHENTDRWLVSYADFITLLFAFFTTMYAISHVDLGKLERFTGSMKVAFRAAGTYPAQTTVIEGIKPINYEDVGLEQDVRGLLRKFDIIESFVVTRDDRGVVLSFSDELLFDAGSAELKKEARPLLGVVASIVQKSRRQVIIEGHTDNMPIGKSRYSSNLELATARAANVFAALLEEHAAGADRMSTAGYGEYRPATSNATPEGRARNRRVDIVFVSGREGT